LIEGRITLTITDHGSGISQEDLPHLFDRFYRAERARNRRSGGVGLGLAIVRSIADEYGYEIDVQSTLGVGTCIIVMLK
jgi:two-component system sensor histidine kinase ArlS